MQNYKKIYAIKKANKEKILKICPYVSECSGIYILTREENGFKYAYVGQAKNMLERLADHLSGYQHIDLSIKNHRWYSENNKTGWKIERLIQCEIRELDNKEQEYILEYHNLGYQLHNKTAGGQGEGKVKIAEYKPAKNYHDGLKQGYKNAQKFISKLFDKNLIYEINGKETVNKIKAKNKFEDFLKMYEN